MSRLRVIPTLLADRKRLIKGTKFKNHNYIGDAINALKIFNEKEVDELVFLDIKATAEGRGPDFQVVQDIATEAFFPLAYGGGIRGIDDVQRLMSLGVEKVVFGTAAFLMPDLVRESSELIGSQSVVVSVDYKKTFLKGLKVFVKNGELNTNFSPLDYAKRMEDLGAGELIISSIDREGSYSGYDTEVLKEISASVSIPVVASGGAGSITDILDVSREARVSAVSAGSLFVFYGPHKAVLINYPSYDIISDLLNRGN